MPRNLSSDMLTALSASILYPAIFVELTFSSGPVYLWSGIGSVSWNAQTWTGLGAFLGLTTPEDSSNVEAKGITISLSGLDATLMPDALSEVQLGLPAIAYLGLYTSLGGSIIDTPVLAWAGRMDRPTFTIGGTEATIDINCENRLIDMNIPVDRRYTNEDQQMDHPCDLGFSFVDAQQEKNIIWGFPMTSTNI
jgi:hypothetical protein